jgi:hypothetical protein
MIVLNRDEQAQHRCSLAPRTVDNMQLGDGNLHALGGQAMLLFLWSAARGSL